MKKIFLLFMILSSFACAARNQATITPEVDTSARASQKLTEEEMMKVWVEYATPGEEHNELNRFVGVWDNTLSVWMDPEKEPEITKGKSEIKWVMNGRHIEHTFNGTSMGEKYTGRGIIGYDKALNKYRSIWYDNMGTGMMISTGVFEPQTNTFKDSGISSCPLQGTKEYSFVTTFTDDNNFRSEMYMQDPLSGANMRTMLIEYTRAKK